LVFAVFVFLIAHRAGLDCGVICCMFLRELL
jgi:hypothetical protein